MSEENQLIFQLVKNELALLLIAHIVGDFARALQQKKIGECECQKNAQTGPLRPLQLN